MSRYWQLCLYKGIQIRTVVHAQYLVYHPLVLITAVTLLGMLFHSVSMNTSVVSFQISGRTSAHLAFMISGPQFCFQYLVLFYQACTWVLSRHAEWDGGLGNRVASLPPGCWISQKWSITTAALCTRALSCWKIRLPRVFWTCLMTERRRYSTCSTTTALLTDFQIRG